MSFRRIHSAALIASLLVLAAPAVATKAPFIVIEGASHSVYESHPAQVAAIIEEAARKVGEATQ